MHVVTKYPDGVFCWVDLSTPDPEGAKAFYTGLFGWTADDRPIDGGGIYTTMLIDGHTVAGLGEQMPDMKAQGVPAFWTSYVKHDNADEVAARVAEAGGAIMLPPMDVMEEGRMMMAVDPTGAVFGVWQPGNHTGAQIVNSPGALVWNELQTRDVEAAKAFYHHVFGWSNEADANGYIVYAQAGRGQAGCMAIDESWGSEVPPNWSVYFMVEDVDATVARAVDLGGRVVVGPQEAGEMGRFAVISDPQGGVFTVMRFNGPTDPPPGA